MFPRLKRIASKIARIVLATAVCFILSSPSIVVTKTQAGLHCPTAAVQLVKDADGTLRTPKPGDISFKQCDCAEKKAAQENSNLERIALSTVIPAVTIQPLIILAFPICLSSLQAIPSWLQRRLELLVMSPSVPPPNI
jgi:hypothetical protein